MDLFLLYIYIYIYIHIEIKVSNEKYKGLIEQNEDWVGKLRNLQQIAYKYKISLAELEQKNPEPPKTYIAFQGQIREKLKNYKNKLLNLKKEQYRQNQENRQFLIKYETEKGVLNKQIKELQMKCEEKES